MNYSKMLRSVPLSFLVLPGFVPLQRPTMVSCCIVFLQTEVPVTSPGIKEPDPKLKKTGQSNHFSFECMFHYKVRHNENDK